MKKSLVFFGTILLLFCNSEKILAATPYNNKTALSVGVKYSDGTSGVDHSNNSYGTYVTMGLTTKKLNSTNATNIISSHSNGTKYLESGIIYLVGHANRMAMSFDNNVTIDYSKLTDSPSVGIRSFNNSKSAFVTFAGCNTALPGAEYNITELTQANGAKITMGWKTDLNIASYKNWNSRFNEIIKDKNTSVLNAAKSASDHIYLSNTVKNYALHGIFNKNPWYFLNNNSASNMLISEALQNEVTNIKNIDLKDVNMYLDSYLNNSVDLNNFKLEINGVHEKYYDYVLYINDVRTDLGYTVVMDNDSKLNRIVDNMKGKTVAQVKNEMQSKLQKIDVNNITVERRLLNKIKLDISDDYKIISNIKYYSSSDNEIYSVAEIEMNDGNGKLVTSYIERY